jgi:hypothetical protein
VTIHGEDGKKESYSILGSVGRFGEGHHILPFSSRQSFVDKKTGDVFAYDYAGDKKKYHDPQDRACRFRLIAE